MLQICFFLEIQRYCLWSFRTLRLTGWPVSVTNTSPISVLQSAAFFAFFFREPHRLGEICPFFQFPRLFRTSPLKDHYINHLVGSKVLENLISSYDFVLLINDLIRLPSKCGYCSLSVRSEHWPVITIWCAIWRDSAGLSPFLQLKKFASF